jgi:hypothetical protein
MSNRSIPRARLAIVLTDLALSTMACLLLGCASVGSTPPYVSDADKAKAQDPCQASGQDAQKTPDGCKKSGAK